MSVTDPKIDGKKLDVYRARVAKYAAHRRGRTPEDRREPSLAANINRQENAEKWGAAVAGTVLSEISADRLNATQRKCVTSVFVCAVMRHPILSS